MEVLQKGARKAIGLSPFKGAENYTIIHEGWETGMKRTSLPGAKEEVKPAKSRAKPLANYSGPKAHRAKANSGVKPGPWGKALPMCSQNLFGLSSQAIKLSRVI